VRQPTTAKDSRRCTSTVLNRALDGLFFVLFFYRLLQPRDHRPRHLRHLIPEWVEVDQPHSQLLRQLLA